MISKLRFSLIAVVMLVLVGFGFQNQAQGQPGLNGLMCPAVPDTTGWLMTERLGPGGVVAPHFSAGLIGTVENSGADAVGGLDWQHVDFTSGDTPTPTNEAGSQLVSWWTLKSDRNTYLQVTNSNAAPVTVHVRIHNEACVEIRDFCDNYTGYDTHEYDFSNLVTNNGVPVLIPGIDNEGWLVVTAVEGCQTPGETAIEHNALSGQLIIHDADDYLYGVNTYARQGVCFDQEFTVLENQVVNGDFATGNTNGWTTTQGTTTIAAQNGDFLPEADLPDNSDYGAMVISQASVDDGQYDGGVYDDIVGIAALPNELITGGAGTEEAVTVFQSAALDLGDDDSNTLSFDLQAYNGFDEVCDAFTAVLLIETTDPDPADYEGTIVDSVCWVSQDSTAGLDIEGIDCLRYANSFDTAANFNGTNAFDFSLPLASDTLTRDNNGEHYIQVVTGITDGCVGLLNTDNRGALVTNFVLNRTIDDVIACDGDLDGEFNAFLDPILPNVLSAQFNILPGNVQAGADVVLINFADVYGPPYRPVAANTNYFVSIWDDNERPLSCGDLNVCFVRYGVDDALVMSENFSPATPTAPPTTAPPTLIPTTAPPTLIPTTPPPTGGGSNGSCAIAGSPVQLGTALANVLIPLVPVAFAFGVRAVRRRKK